MKKTHKKMKNEDCRLKICGIACGDTISNYVNSSIFNFQFSIHSVVKLLFIAVFFSAGTVAAASNGRLQIYLPRDIKIDSPTPTLGQITILNGDEAMAKAASSIAMGRLALVDQNLIIDRPTILSRLASSGISASKVKFTGAEKVVVSLKNTIISSEKILQMATNCIKASAGQNKISTWTLTRPPDDLLLGELKANISLKASQSLVQPNVVRVFVEVFADGRLVGKQFVDFRVKYSASQIVAATDIVKDSIVTPQNTKVQKVEADFRQIAAQTAFYGMTARGDIKQGTAIVDNMLYNPKPPVVVKRNQNVVIKIDSSSMTITTTGKAMRDGVAGEIIRVQNTDSKRVIMAKVNADGSVEPVL